MTIAAAPDHLTPSELGTKQYWDEAYTRELANHSLSPTDEGTVWFSDASAEEKILEYLDKLADEGHLMKEKNFSKEGEGIEEPATSFLDLGTGNGHLLFALREEGWEGRMIGVDYSATSVKLARQIGDARAREVGSTDDSGTNVVMEDVQFEEWDVLSSPPGPWLKSGFDVVLDKGTFDAISLSADTDVQGKRICEGYRERVEKLVRMGGLLLITSCNWTEEELRKWFEVEGGLLMYHDKVRYPTFTFGGKSGQKVATLCFKRVDDTTP